MTADQCKPGTVVAGPFHGSDNPPGVGIIVARGRELWTHVGDGFVPVRVIVGNRASGGYLPHNLRALSDLRPA